MSTSNASFLDEFKSFSLKRFSREFQQKSLFNKKFISSICQIIILIENYHLLIRFLFGVSTNDFRNKIIKDLANLFIDLSKNFRRKSNKFIRK
jgi:hypothetical protein